MVPWKTGHHRLTLLVPLTRASGINNLVDSLTEERVVLEKIRVVESGMKCQIENLVHVADKSPKAVTEDPSEFRPDPRVL